MIIAWIALGLALALLAVYRHRYIAVVVEGRSMQPTLHHGERLIARRLARRERRTVRRGDVVVFPVQDPRNLIYSAQLPLRVKRIAALPGDPVPAWLAEVHATPDGCVPAGAVAIAGDNTASSEDSRQLGYIALDSLIAVTRRPRS